MAHARILRRAVAAAATASLLCGPGCSHSGVRRPPAGPIAPSPPLECTSSVAYPVLDTVVAAFMVGVFGAVAIAGAVQQQPTVMWWGISLGLLGAALPTYSAVYGYSTTARCRELQQAQLSCIGGVEAACQTLAAPGRD
jgi:hypothetical protein